MYDKNKILGIYYNSIHFALILIVQAIESFWSLYSTSNK